MQTEPTYRDYVTDQTFQHGYGEYQQRYATNIRESDRVLIELVRGLAARRQGKGPVSLLDVGCSTGNLLLHLKRLVPELELTGGDMVPAILAENRKNPNLAGARFEEIDMLDIPHAGRFDLVTANAVVYLFREPEFDRALASVAKALKPGGWFLAFDWFHPYEQELAILEKSETHPDGLLIHARPYSRVTAALHKHGLINADFKPFAIPIDLENPAAAADMRSYTVSAADGRRLLFRGTLFQPWCHLVAQKQR